MRFFLQNKDIMDFDIYAQGPDITGLTPEDKAVDV